MILRTLFSFLIVLAVIALALGFPALIIYLARRRRKKSEPEHIYMGDQIVGHCLDERTAEPAHIFTSFNTEEELRKMRADYNERTNPPFRGRPQEKVTNFETEYLRRKLVPKENHNPYSSFERKGKLPSIPHTPAPPPRSRVNMEYMGPAPLSVEDEQESSTPSTDDMLQTAGLIADDLSSVMTDLSSDSTSTDTPTESPFSDSGGDAGGGGAGGDY